MPEIVNSEKVNRASRQRIVDAALRLFSKKGFSGTGLRELATEADVNVAMVSYFFGSKKGLLKELLDTFFSGYLDIARSTLSGNEPVEPRLRRFIATTLSYFENNRNALLIALAEIPRDDPEIIKYKMHWAQQMIVVIDQKLCQPIAREQNRTIPPHILGPLLTSTLAARFLFAPILEQVTPERSASPLDSGTVEQLTDVLLHGLLVRSES